MADTTLSNSTLESAHAVDLPKTLGGAVVRIDHVAIAVPDLLSAIRWYTQQCGFRLLETRTTRGERTGMISAVVAAGAAIIVLVQGTEPDSQVSKFVAAHGAGLQHMAFEVRNLKSVMRELEVAGVKGATPILEGDGIRQVFLSRDDASGNQGGVD